MPIAVLIADDHPLVRSGLRQILGQSGLMIVAEAGTPLEALSYALDPAVEVMLLDISWSNCANPTRDLGLELLREIRSARPDLPILMYSTEAGSECIERCRHRGANGYLVKGLDEASLPLAVHAAHAGDQIWPDSRHTRPPVWPESSNAPTARR